jgi:hypothetical protein
VVHVEETTVVTEEQSQPAQATDETSFGLHLPPNARVKTLTFDDAQRKIHVTLEGDDNEHLVPVERIRSLYGARIRHESVTEFKAINQAHASVAFVTTAMTGIPIAPKVNKSDVVVTTEELMFVFGLRVDGLDPLWYFMATSFNFRKALGPLATYSTELNVREFVKRFAGFAPQAVQDSFFTAITKSLPLPPPVDTLIEFFRVVAR